MDAGILITWKSLGAFTSITVVIFTFLFYVLGKAFVPRREVYGELKERDDKLEETLKSKQDVAICNAIQKATHVSIGNIQADISELKTTTKETAGTVQKIALAVTSIGAKLNGG